jgi:antitoxin CcdA
MHMGNVMPVIQTQAQAKASRSTRSRGPAKRATNLSLSADVLEAAKSLRINVSQVCDLYLRTVVKLEQERRWREEHTDFISAYNATIAAEGLALDEWKSF